MYHFSVGAVEDAGFVDHPGIENAGASPDGYTGDEGLIEIKCPKTATHLDTIESGKMDRKYWMQMQWQMACAGRKWCDFVSYDPRMVEGLRMWVIRVERDDEWIETTEREIEAFLAEVDEKVSSLERKALEGYKIG